MEKLIKNHPEELIKGFKEIFHKLYGVIPTVTYAPKATEPRLTIPQLWDITQKVLDLDPDIPVYIKQTAKKVGSTFSARCYRYSFIKECIDAGHQPVLVAFFLGISDSSVNYACRALKLAYTLDDPKSLMMRTIYAKVYAAIKKETDGDI